MSDIVFEAEIDEDEIQKSLDLIDEEQKALKEVEDKNELPAKLPELDGNALVNLAVQSFNDIKSKSDEIYDAFYGNVATRQDRSDVSKQMLTDSQRLKIESMNAIANMFNAQAKLAAAQAKQSQGNVGVFINSKSGEDVGINLTNLAD